ncbi:MAG TPA: M14 family metallopeptidase [Acidimicrobiia bacterium]|nr:M14 family metallopeptidase [Acidimicrobiia bacterium]
MDGITFDRLYKYGELMAALDALAAARPDLVTLESIGKSHEGRDIRLVTITNSATGPHDEKPAIWIDANIHSTEVTGSTAALHLLHRLVTQHGEDERVTRAVDTRTFYVVPRVNPDGVELALAKPPTYLRSSVRRWPRVDDPDGLVEGDIDGDGRILSMRVADPNGAWKIAAEDARLMVPRAPDEDGAGPYYRLLAEGTIRNYDGVLVPNAREPRALDLNRNFPVNWRTNGEQQGSGPFPSSEPEVHTIMQAVVDRPNICAYFAHHTFSAVILRPYDDRPDDQFPTEDLRAYNDIGKHATAITGYKQISVFHEFRYDPKDVISGAADMWAYEHVGVFGWTTEFWSPLPKAGITDYHFVDWFADHPIADDLALLKWNDEALGGRGFVPWTPFEHPQLGPVEIGGWDWFNVWGNAPAELMETEVAPHSDFHIWTALVTPRLRIRSADVDRLADSTWRIRLAVENDGWLPTNVTAKATEKKLVDGVTARITPAAGVRLVSGTERIDLGQLAGRNRARSMLEDFGSANDPTTDRAKAEWVVDAPDGTQVEITARHPRAGVVRTTVTLSAS